jgi:OTU domain-containing protein 5
MKRINGVWGDDIEIQALSELYNRPIEIYSHSIEPLKTFHENVKGFSRLDGERVLPLPSIKISYHGSSHYNSLIPVENYAEGFKNYFLKTKPGDYENAILEKVKMKKLQQEGCNLAIVIPESNIEASRENFLEKSKNLLTTEKKDLDLMLDELYAKTSSTPSILADTIKQSDDLAVENDLIKQAIEMSIKETATDTETKQNQAIQFVVEMGFTLEEAVLAFSAVGGDPDLMLQYLYSLNI